MKEETLISKIVEVNSFGIGKGIAEGIEWKVFRLVKPQTEVLQVGQYISCSVLYDEDNDEFYLRRLEADYHRTEMEWLEQEAINQ